MRGCAVFDQLSRIGQSGLLQAGPAAGPLSKKHNRDVPSLAVLVYL
jgi:hypothetical protein